MSTFYDEKKQCRKSVFTTPEHITDQDWAFMRLLISAATKGIDNVYFALYGRQPEDQCRAFFDRMIGWPEGYGYCRDLQYWSSAGAAMVQSQLLKIADMLLKRQCAGSIVCQDAQAMIDKLDDSISRRNTEDFDGASSLEDLLVEARDVIGVLKSQLERKA